MATQETQEIYVRNATETEARGPFNATQVADLAEVGQVTPESLIYDAGTEQWVALSTKPELMAVVFPAKKKLSLRAKEVQALNVKDETVKPITVDDMMAAAEGRTGDTKDKADPTIARARAARFGMWGAILALAVAAAGEILPGAAALVSGEGAQIIAQPLVILGVIDLVLAVLLGLGMVTLYPFVRFRAALGLGWLGLTFFLQGQPQPLLYAVAGSTGLYLCTVLTSLVPVLASIAAAVCGMGLLAQHFLTR
ncbi:MAG: DUF4339 domain-containing protein [Opitutaceae bacterium]|nr:DUF4339 domain-containing protein [Opitutaceae bacterium]